MGEQQHAAPAGDEGLVECLICRGRFHAVGRHVARKHGLSATAYRDRFGLARSASLCAPALRERHAAAIRRTIDSGALDAHFARNGDRAASASRAGLHALRTQQNAGIRLRGAPAKPRAVYEAVVRDIETGAGVAEAVKRAAISISGFHSALQRLPDLKARVEAAKIGRKRPAYGAAAQR